MLHYSSAVDEAAFKQVLAALPPTLPPVPPPAPPVALPVGAGHGAEPFIISIGSQDGESGIYWLLAIVNGLVLCTAAALYFW